MATLYPLLIKPEFHERVWGARDLRPIYDLQPEKPIGEAWLTGDTCRVQNGEFAGRTLGELCGQFGADLVGEAAPQKDRFPLLIKFLFPREKLSVQVHPDDEMARSMGLPCGKTECWYVLSAEPGAQVGVGLKPGATKEEFAVAIKAGTAEQLLNWIDIHPGELIYVEAGTVHAIGPGSILVETQQNSDTTFRLYDYGRPRQLHLEQGLAAIKEQTRSGKMQAVGEGDMDALVSSPHFMLTRWRLHPEDLPGSTDNAGELAWRSVEVVAALSGSGCVEATGCSPQTLKMGEVVVVPACVDQFWIRPGESGLEALTMYLPPRADSAALADTHAKTVDVSS